MLQNVVYFCLTSNPIYFGLYSVLPLHVTVGKPFGDIYLQN